MSLEVQPKPIMSFTYELVLQLLQLKYPSTPNTGLVLTGSYDWVTIWWAVNRDVQRCQIPRLCGNGHVTNSRCNIECKNVCLCSNLSEWIVRVTSPIPWRVSTVQLLECFSYLSDRDSDNSWYLSPQGNRPPSSTSTKCPSKRRYEESEKGKQEAEIDDTSSSNQKLSKEDKKRRRLEGRIAKASINNAPSATDVRTADGTSKDNIYLKDKNLRQAVPSISSPQNATETEAGLPSGSVSKPG